MNGKELLKEYIEKEVKIISEWISEKHETQALLPYFRK